MTVQQTPSMLYILLYMYSMLLKNRQSLVDAKGTLIIPLLSSIEKLSKNSFRERRQTQPDPCCTYSMYSIPASYGKQEAFPGGVQ